MSNKPTLSIDEILDVFADQQSLFTRKRRERSVYQEEAKQQLTQLIADIIGEDESYAGIDSGDGMKDMVEIARRSSLDQLRAEQRQRAKERGIDL